MLKTMYGHVINKLNKLNQVDYEGLVSCIPTYSKWDIGTTTIF